MDCGVHICIFLVFQFVYLLIIVWCIVGTTAILAYNTKGKVTEILLFGYMQVKCVTNGLTLNIFFLAWCRLGSP